MTIQQIIQADPGWGSVYVEVEEKTEKISKVDIRPIACWALFDDGSVQGLTPNVGDPNGTNLTGQDLALAKGGLQSAELVRYTKTRPIGHFRYVHASMLDRGIPDPQEAALAFMLRELSGAEQPKVPAGFPTERAAG